VNQQKSPNNDCHHLFGQVDSSFRKWNSSDASLLSRILSIPLLKIKQGKIRRYRPPMGGSRNVFRRLIPELRRITPPDRVIYPGRLRAGVSRKYFRPSKTTCGKPKE
jgi:hypothetical protein